MRVVCKSVVFTDLYLQRSRLVEAETVTSRSFRASPVIDLMGVCQQKKGACFIKESFGRVCSSHALLIPRRVIYFIKFFFVNTNATVTHVALNQSLKAVYRNHMRIAYYWVVFADIYLQRSRLLEVATVILRSFRALLVTGQLIVLQHKKRRVALIFIGVVYWGNERWSILQPRPLISESTLQVIKLVFLKLKRVTQRHDHG